MCLDVPTYAGQLATQYPILVTLQHRHARAAILLLIARLAPQATRRVGSRRQPEIGRRLARVTGPALHAAGELGVGRTLGLCVKAVEKDNKKLNTKLVVQFKVDIQLCVLVTP